MEARRSGRRDRILMAIKTGFILEPYLEYPVDKKIEVAKMYFEALVDRQVRPAVVSADVADLTHLQLDLVVFEYGTAQYFDAADVGLEQTQAICMYAKAHPETLVVLWDSQTAKIYRDNFQEKYGSPGNIAIMYIGRKIREQLDAFDARFTEQFIF